MCSEDRHVLNVELRRSNTRIVGEADFSDGDDDNVDGGLVDFFIVVVVVVVRLAQSACPNEEHILHASMFYRG